jgi:hypothetical protein
MSTQDNLDRLFVITAFLFQILLIIHFAVRNWNFDIIVRYGWITYALSVPAAAVSLILLLRGKVGWFWAGGFTYLIWAAYGFVVEFVKRIRWRNPPRWPVLGAYLLLYLTTNMLYWWPVRLVSRPLWCVYTLLYIVSMVLNLMSHKVS